MGFKIYKRSYDTFLKLSVFKRGIILADENLLCGDRLYSFVCVFSQMRNLTGSHKILVCKNADGCLICFYFRRAYFLFAPIILNVFRDIADR